MVDPWYFSSPVWRYMPLIYHLHIANWMMVGWGGFLFPQKWWHPGLPKKHHSGNKKPGALNITKCVFVDVYLSTHWGFFASLLANACPWKMRIPKWKVSFYNHYVSGEGCQTAREGYVGRGTVHPIIPWFVKIPWTWLTLFCVNSFVGSLQGGPVRSL